ncbi:hypothetical protein T492DRAFT_1053727, partial [Pavlovales sp. CCMP2436]
MDLVRASEALSWRHARTLNLPQCQGEDPGLIAWEKANPSTGPAGSVAMLRCPQRQGKEDPPVASGASPGRSHCRSSSPPAASGASTGRSHCRSSSSPATSGASTGRRPTPQLPSPALRGALTGRTVRTLAARSLHTRWRWLASLSGSASTVSRPNASSTRAPAARAASRRWRSI